MTDTEVGMLVGRVCGLVVGLVIGLHIGSSAGISRHQRECVRAGVARYATDEGTGENVFEFIQCKERSDGKAD